MNILDILIVVVLLLSLTGGYRRGFWLTLAQYAGVVVGFLIGARLAPDVVDWFGISDPTGRQLAAFLVLIAASFIGGSVAVWLGGPLRQWLSANRAVGALDSLGGAFLSAVVTLVVVWFLALVFARGPVPEIARAIQDSTIVRRLDAVAPRSPAFLARVQQVLAGTFLPPVFVGLEPSLPAPVSPPPESVNTAGVLAAAASTVRVQGTGCGGIATGSGFAVGSNLVVTNAHVVSGITRISVSPPQGNARSATVVFFDSDRDLAILRAPDLGLAALAPADAQPGTVAAVIGYPGGGPQQVSPGVVVRELTARGRDIYSRDIVNRQIWSVSARVRPGNSGGPVVDLDGRYLGAIFAASVSEPGYAYAIVADEIAPEVQRIAANAPAIDTRTFQCVR